MENDEQVIKSTKKLTGNKLVVVEETDRSFSEKKRRRSSKSTDIQPKMKRRSRYMVGINFNNKH